MEWENTNTLIPKGRITQKQRETSDPNQKGAESMNRVRGRVDHSDSYQPKYKRNRQEKVLGEKQEKTKAENKKYKMAS